MNDGWFKAGIAAMVVLGLGWLGFLVWLGVTLVGKI